MEIIIRTLSLSYISISGAGGGGGWVLQTPPKFRSFDKAEPNSQFRGKYIRNNPIKKRVSLTCELNGTPD
jgi:hypothetical protein